MSLAFIKFQRPKFYRWFNSTTVKEGDKTIKLRKLKNFTQKFYSIKLITLILLIFKFYAFFIAILRRQIYKSIKFNLFNFMLFMFLAPAFSYVMTIRAK